MEPEVRPSLFSKAILTGVCVGFFSTIVCLVYNIIFRESTGYSTTEYINVSTLIFAVNLMFLIIGVLYFIFLRWFKKGNLIFEIVFALLTLFCAWRAVQVHLDTRTTTVEFRELLVGVIVILGIGAALIPLLFHNRKFHEAFL
jgi:hypothetical protein